MIDETNELLNICLKKLNKESQKEINQFPINSFEDIKIYFAKHNIDVEHYKLNNLNNSLNSCMFFVAKVENDKLLFKLIYKNNQKYYFINGSGFKTKINFDELYNSYFHDVLVIDVLAIKNENKNFDNIMKDKNWKIISCISLIYLLINLLSILSGMFLSILTNYVIKMNSINNLIWSVATFILIYTIKNFLIILVNNIVKKYIRLSFRKWFGITWKSVLFKEKNFFNNNINLFLINDYLLNLITFKCCNIATFIVNIATTIITSILLIILNYWYFIISLILCAIIVIISFFKRKNHKELYEENFIFDNQEKNLINNLYILKNTYFDNQYFLTRFHLLNQLVNSNYDFNLNKTIKNERLDLFNSITIQITNLLFLIIIICLNLNSPQLISNYFFIVSINNTFLTNIQGLYSMWIVFPEIKQKNDFINKILKNDNHNKIGIDVNGIQSLTLHNPKFKNFIINKEIKITKSTCLVGPSGIGKSYLFWSIANQENLSFKLTINNLSFSNINQSSLKENIIYLKNDTPLLSNKFELILNEKEYQELITTFLQITNLNLYDIMNENLSSGQIQMINILSLLNCQNKLILLDEVTSNIDHKILTFFNKYVFPKIKEKNLIIAISHNPQTINEYEEIINLYEFIQEDYHNHHMLK